MTRNMPLVAHGFWHPACCPCKTFVPTAEELAAMEANRMTARAEAERDAARSRPKLESLHLKVHLASFPVDGVIRRLKPDYQFRSSAVRRAVWAEMRDGVTLGAVLKAIAPHGEYARTVVWKCVGEWGLAEVVRG